MQYQDGKTPPKGEWNAPSPQLLYQQKKRSQHTNWQTSRARAMLTLKMMLKKLCKATGIDKGLHC